MIVDEAAQQAPKVPTRTVFSWHYYEREDQYEDLFESLNLKGQRERKLQENLKKIKDRLKLKKSKRKPLPVQPEAPLLKAESVMTSNLIAGNDTSALPGDSELNKTVSEITGVVGEGAEPNSAAVANEQTIKDNAEGPSKTMAINGDKQVEMADEETAKPSASVAVEADKSEVDITKSEINATEGYKNDDTVLEEDESKFPSEESEDLVRHVMFETDNWEDCITEAVWFGQKIPQKRRAVGRAA